MKNDKKTVVILLVLVLAVAAAFAVGFFMGRDNDEAVTVKPEQVKDETVVENKTEIKDPYKRPDVIRHKVMLKDLKRFKVKPGVKASATVNIEADGNAKSKE